MILEDAENGFPHILRAMLYDMVEHLKIQQALLRKIDKEKAAVVKTIEPCQRLTELEGVGPVGASMLYTTLGDGGYFKNGRQASTYIGLTPKQHSSGGKTVILGINKVGGNKALRAVLYQGALSIVSNLPKEPKTRKQQWLIDLKQRVGIKRTCIALANKTARTAWALLSSGESYQPQAVTT
jgi:transposase